MYQRDVEMSDELTAYNRQDFEFIYALFPSWLVLVAVSEGGIKIARSCIHGDVERITRLVIAANHSALWHASRIRFPHVTLKWSVDTITDDKSLHICC